MTWHELVQLYAIRAREFSDTVARLGRHHHIGPELLGLIRETKRLRGLCEAVADQLEQHVSQAGESGASTHGKSATQPLR
jgi:hypothetical protein